MDPSSSVESHGAGDARDHERAGMRALVEEVVDAGPRRVAGSVCEREAHQILDRRFMEAGLETEVRPFRFGTHLYANLVLHFGLVLVGVALFPVSPWIALALHATVAISYTGDSLHRFYLLRRLLGFRGSQNLLGVQRAEGETELRVVLVAHADAAYTGRIFDPRVVKRLSGHRPGSRPPRGLARPLRVALFSVGALALVDALALVVPGGWVLPVLGLLAIPSLLVVVVNLDVVLRNQVVPGANDNLSGCAAVRALAQRMREAGPPGVELVYVVTGAEEAGVGGAWALCRQMRDRWDPSRTVILGLDGLTGGQLRYFQEAELSRLPVARWLEEILRDVAGTDARFASLDRFEMGVGATDAGPFQAAGYDAVTLGCVDPQLGAPRHYHLPADTLANLDLDQLQLAVDLAERVVREIAVRRTSG